MTIVTIPPGSVVYYPAVPYTTPRFKYSYNDLLSPDYFRAMDAIDARCDEIEQEIQSLGQNEPVAPWEVK